MPGFETIGDEEFAELKSIFENGGVLFRQGFEPLRNGVYKVREFEDSFAEAMQVPHALAVSSGTAALRVALAALNVGAGQEVIAPSFTFVATVEAIVESAATPVCCDVDRTLNMDPEALEKAITPQTKAVIVVHMLGTPARLKEIKAICDRHNLFLIEDTAWGCGGDIDGRPLGTWGDVGTFSFDFAKTLTTGEGGMVICRDREVHERAAAWHDHGHENNPMVPRWEDTRSSSGFNFRMTEMQGAVGLAQIKKLPSIVERQRSNASLLWSALQHIEGIEPRDCPSGGYETADALTFFVPSKDIALKCRQALIENGYGTKILPEAVTWHFAATWEHITELKARHNHNLAGAFMETQKLLECAVCLPISINMLDEQPAKIAAIISSVLNPKGA
jgi:8-amino-3,8-dideoxy-alpha-D-manno-octulosonate transaminase